MTTGINRAARIPMVAVVLAGMIAATAIVASPSAAIAAPAIVADWQMNEPAGATTMIDSSGYGQDGSIGADVFVGTEALGAIGYRWKFTSPSKSPYQPERIVSVPHHESLNPGAGDYAIALRYRTTQPFGNIVQKGQGGAAGGYWKIENPNGHPTCVFRAPDGSGGWTRREVVSPTPYNDGNWHTVKCERVGTDLLLTVDDVPVATAAGMVGAISNTNPISIGGKSNCDNVKITCDYYTGDIDWIRVSSTHSPPAPPPPPGPTVFSDDFSSNSLSAWFKTRNFSLDLSTGAAAAPSGLTTTVDTNGFARGALSSTTSHVCASTAIAVRSAVGSVVFLQLRTAANKPVVSLFLNNKGQVVFKSNVSGARKGSGTALGSEWTTVEVCGDVGQNGSWDVRIDDQVVIAGFRTDTGSTAIGQVQIGSAASETLDISYDDVKVTS